MWSKSQWESSCLSSKVSSAAWLCPSLPIKSQYSSNKVFFQGTVKVLIKLFLSAFWSNVTASWWWWWTMCAITSRWCKSRLNLVGGLSEKVSRRILVFTGSFGFKWKYLLETGDLEDDLQISKMFMNSRAMCLASIKNMRWQIHLNHFNKDNIKDCERWRIWWY